MRALSGLGEERLKMGSEYRLVAVNQLLQSASPWAAYSTTHSHLRLFSRRLQQLHPNHLFLVNGAFRIRRNSRPRTSQALLRTSHPWPKFGKWSCPIA